jgi:putative heme-binding domain-containing protein
MLTLALGLLGLAAFRVANYWEMRREALGPQRATSPMDIRVLPGFKVTLLHSADPGEGSWISMTIDSRGRLIVSPQDEGPLLRMTISDGKLENIERIPRTVAPAMGLLYARNSLFLDCKGPKGWGIYRMRDKEGVFGEPELLRPLDFFLFGHGCHAIVLGPDEKLYVVCGDHTRLPPDILATSPFHNEAEDQLLPSEEDPTWLEMSVRVPAGFTLRMDLDGGNCELFAGGARNTYSMAFNADGELFGFDNDNDNELGLPWYRPTRIDHWISGGDYGYRQGSGKLPEYYEDTLPATLNVGLGAPTGVKFSPPNCAYPAPYRDACFMADWSYGRLFAVHFFPRGATYDATIETVLRGIPLNLTAMEFGQDGTLYFITGGLLSESGLYRLTWNGAPMPAIAKSPQQLAAEKQALAARNLRHELELFQGRRNARAVDVAWPSLSSQDRWLRYPARIGLESQDVGIWKNRALQETNKFGGLTALLALARCADTKTQPDLLRALEKFRFSDLSEEQRLLKLRVMEVSFIRQGHPNPDMSADIIAELNPLYPSASFDLNHELCQLLLYLDAPEAIAKSLSLLDTAPTREEQIYYVMRLRTITNGWSLSQRANYLAWFLKDRTHATPRPDVLPYFKEVGQDFHPGESFDLCLDAFRREAVKSLGPADRQALAQYLPLTTEARVPISTRKFVKAWRIEDLLPHVSKLKTGRLLARGRAALVGAGCLQCHRFAGEGGSFGPDLSAVASRMSLHDILQSILEPSKVIAQQYQNSVLTLSNGDVLSGRVIGEDDKKLLMITDPIRLARVSVPNAEIVARRLSEISPMPEGLVNSLSEDEIWDLIARLESAPRTALASENK